MGSPSAASAQTNDGLAGGVIDDALSRAGYDMAHYESMGDHRTGSDVDRATSTWLSEELLAAGVDDVRLVPLGSRQFVLRRGVLKVGGHSLDCFPFWFPHATGSEPVIGPLRLMGQDTAPGSLAGAVAYVELPEDRLYASFDVSGLIERATVGSAAALVVVIPHPEGLVAAQNAVEAFAETELGLPAVIVGAADRSLLRTASERGDEASLTIEGSVVEHGEALNVVGRIEREGRPWIVVTTPTSGWFRCADERGPGIALWLALARWAARTEVPASFLFQAYSGHELDFLGGRRAFEGGLPDPREVMLWVHLGAGIGVVDPLASLVTGPDPMKEVLVERFAGPMAMDFVPRDKVPETSEMGMAIAAGYPVVGLYGANRDVHLRSDDEPTASVGRLREITRAITALIVEQVRTWRAVPED